MIPSTLACNDEATSRAQDATWDDHDVFIVIPAYNEAQRIAAVLDELVPRYENIVVVDDGSHDGTEEIAKSYPVHCLRHVVNRGQGAALQTGISYSLKCGARYVVTYDADGQHQSADLSHMLEPVRSERCEVVLGSRFLDTRSNVPFARRCLLYAARLFTWSTSGIYLTDCHNGLRALSRHAAATIRLQQDGMAHASEIYDQIVQHRLSYQEVPVHIRYTAGTLEKGQSGSNAIRIVVHYLLGKMVK